MSTQPRHPRQPLTLSRRELLRMLGLGGAATALGGCALSRSMSPNAAATNVRAPTSPKPGSSVSAKDRAAPRALVVIELQGGHDGFAMLVPYADARFRKLRDRIWVDRAELVAVDDRYAMAKGLAPVAKQLAFLEGVGVPSPDLSHFAMLQRWWTGDPDGTRALPTGFLGRCCDALMGHEPVTGITIAGGSTPALVSAKATTVALPALDNVRDFTNDEPDQRRTRTALQQLSHDGAGLGDPDTDRLLAMARAGLAAGLDLASMVGDVGELTPGYPTDNDLASALSAVRQLVSAGSGIRVFHVPWGSFDTHTNEVGTHTDHMNRLGAALAAFHADLAAHGLDDRVLVATTSEFGRRPEANAGGTDHGTASTMALLGPARPGRHGEAVDFGRLDDTGNVRATVSMSDYLATLATWLGIPPAEVLPARGTVIDTLGLTTRV